MCSTGGGNSFIESVVDVATQIGTGGLVGYKSDDGGLGAGLFGKPLVKGAKEITGAAAAEEANELARQQLEEERATALKEREEARAQTAREQLKASRGAAASRRGGQTLTGTRTGAGTIGDEEDFLGL